MKEICSTGSGLDSTDTFSKTKTSKNKQNFIEDKAASIASASANNLIIYKCENKHISNCKYLIANKVELIDLNTNLLSSSSSQNTNKRCSSPKKFPIYCNLETLKRENISFEQLIMNSNSSSTSSLADPNKIHLFVKAGQDGRSQGACPFCQSVFLQLLIKAQTNKFNFDVITINMDNPPKEFKELSIKPPVLIHGSSKLLEPNLDMDDSSESQAIILSDVDEIAEYLDDLYPNSKLIVNNPEANKVCLNVFSKFSFFVRDVASQSNSLEIELEKIDNYLRENIANEDSKKRFFINGTQMTQLDCSLLPKLQHIRVAGEAIKKFRIPSRFRYLLKYIQSAYESEAFQKSCPPDREIIWNWSKTFLTHKDLLQIIQEAPYKTLSLPDNVN